MILKIDSRLFWRAGFVKLFAYLCLAIILVICSLYLLALKREIGIIDLSTELFSCPSSRQFILLSFLIPVIIWMVELLPDYWKYNGLLTIDEYGLRYFCPRQPLYSWNLAWAEIQTPVYRHRLFRSSTLYIPQRRGDGSMPAFWSRFLALSSYRTRQHVWRIHHADYWRCVEPPVGEAYPSIVAAITAHLGTEAIKTTRWLPVFISEDARRTQQIMLSLRFPRWMHRFASLMGVGSLLFFMAGVGLQFYAAPKIRLLGYPLLLWLVLALASVVSTVFLLRRTKTVWPVSVFVGSLCGAALVWCLFSAACVQTAQWGERSIVRFELQHSSPSAGRQSSAPLQYWRSVTAEAPLLLTISEDMMLNRYESGAQIDLPVRHNLGITMLVLDEPIGIFDRQKR